MTKKIMVFYATVTENDGKFLLPMVSCKMLNQKFNVLEKCMECPKFVREGNHFIECSFNEDKKKEVEKHPTIEVVKPNKNVKRPTGVFVP